MVKVQDIQASQLLKTWTMPDYNLAYEKYKERFADAGDFNFYFVGNIDEEKLVDYCETYLASLPGKGSNETYKVMDFRPLTGFSRKDY